MEKETIKKIFDFLEENDNRKTPFLWKIMNNEPFTDDELHIKDDLDLSHSNITSLPEGLKVGGSLILSGLKITSLPKSLEVKGSLSLYRSEITSLPEGLKVGYDLILTYSTITSLPRGLKVGGYIYIFGSKLTRYTDDELREMIKPGYIKGKINR
jgi:hypothetical protein